MSYGDKRQHERISQHERMSGLGNIGASTSGNPGDGSNATLSDPTQMSERVHVRSYVCQIEHLIEQTRLILGGLDAGWVVQLVSII